MKLNKRNYSKNPRDYAHHKCGKIINLSTNFDVRYTPYLIGINISYQIGRVLNGTRKENYFYTGI